MNHVIPNVTLHDGRSIPQLGFGMFRVDPQEAERVASEALEVGYRHLDSAAVYRNERAVGAAIAGSGIPRNELFVTTKVWNSDQGRDRTRDALLRSLEDLGLDYIDLYLIHWPAPMHGLYVETWEVLAGLHAEGLVRSIGVSNFMVEHLEALERAGGPVPVVNQIEEHPYFQQHQIRAYCSEHGIAIEAWGPLGQGRTEVLNDPVVLAIASDLARTPAQVVLRWHLQRGSIVFPKSTSRERMVQNKELFDFALTPAQQQALDGLDQGYRVGKHPYEQA